MQDQGRGASGEQTQYLAVLALLLLRIYLYLQAKDAALNAEAPPPPPTSHRDLFSRALAAGAGERRSTASVQRDDAGPLPLSKTKPKPLTLYDSGKGSRDCCKR